jgi:hypothetical protein
MFQVEQTHTMHYLETMNQIHLKRPNEVAQAQTFPKLRSESPLQNKFDMVPENMKGIHFSFHYI